MPISLIHAARFLNRPLALATEYALFLPEMIARPEAAIVTQSDNGNYLYDVVDGVAIVPIRGVLVSADTGWFDEMCYNLIEYRITSAINDAKVKAVVLHLCSPGGEVDGCFELADKIYGMRGDKPIVAIGDYYFYSAAYALASAADSISIPRTGGAGSVGVVAVHMEMSKMLKDMGLGVTVIQYGAQKTERGPFAPLSAGAEERLQAEIDELGEMFVDLVARNRGLSAADVKATKAGVFLGAAAVENGLVDVVASPQEAFTDLVEQVNS